MFREAFSKAARREGTGKTAFLDAILSERPDLKGTPGHFPTQGQKGHVVIIGDEVFKGPVKTSGESMDDYNTENETLRALEGRKISTAIPRITTEGRDFIFFGMTRVPGETMGYDYDSRLTKDEQSQLAKDLVNFVIELAQALPQKEGKFATHDDLYYNNIMIDPATKRLSGVIDFGIVKYKSANEWKPMYDFDGTPFADMLKREFNARKAELPGAGAAAPAFTGIRRLLAKISL